MPSISIIREYSSNFNFNTKIIFYVKIYLLVKTWLVQHSANSAHKVHVHYVNRYVTRTVHYLPYRYVRIQYNISLHAVHEYSVQILSTRTCTLFPVQIIVRV